MPISILPDSTFPSSVLGYVVEFGVTNICIDSILRSAWKSVRLDAIREVVQQTIGDLEELAVAQVLGRQPSRSELEVETGSPRAAFDACCDELREGCGLPRSPGRSAQQVQPMRAADSDWSKSFTQALEAYRSAACKALDASLAALALPLPPANPPSTLETL